MSIASRWTWVCQHNVAILNLCLSEYSHHTKRMSVNSATVLNVCLSTQWHNAERVSINTVTPSWMYVFQHSDTILKVCLSTQWHHPESVSFNTVTPPWTCGVFQHSDTILTVSVNSVTILIVYLSPVSPYWTCAFQLSDTILNACLSTVPYTPQCWTCLSTNHAERKSVNSVTILNVYLSTQWYNAERVSFTRVILCSMCVFQHSGMLLNVCLSKVSRYVCQQCHYTERVSSNTVPPKWTCLSTMSPYWMCLSTVLPYCFCLPSQCWKWPFDRFSK